MMLVSEWSTVLRQGLKFPHRRAGASAAEACMAAGSVVDRHVAESAAVRDYLSRLEKGEGSCCPDSNVEEIARFLGHRRGDINQSDPSLMSFFAESLMRPVFLLRHEMVLMQAMRQRRSDQYVVPILFRAMAVADAMNGLYLSWVRDVSCPFHRQPSSEHERLAAAWASQLAAYDYSVFTVSRDGRCRNRRTWAKAFPWDVLNVRQQLAGLAEVLTDKATRRYLKALDRAYGEKSVKRLEERWADVDRCWIEILPDAEFVPVHGMENYEHPYGVSPEFRLSWRVTGEAEGEMIRAYRAAALDYIDAREADLSASAEAGRSKLNRLDIGVFFSVVEGGCCLLHRLAGQVVPNRQEILLQGGKVFIADQTSGSTATELYRDSVRRNCTPEAAAAVCPLVSDEAMTRHTLGHECSHPIGCSPAIDAALGVTRDLLEETKASTGGFLIGLAVDDSDLAVQDTAAVAVARVLRFMLKSRLEEPSISPYVRENLVVLHTLLESGVVSLTDQGLAVDLSRARLDGWLTLVGQFVSSILDAYQRHDRQKLTEVRLKTCGADDRGGNDAMKDIIAWVNRK